ncbi:MAG: hypothetical protein WB711_05585, partial [Terriglobales bacterium]
MLKVVKRRKIYLIRSSGTLINLRWNLVERSTDFQPQASANAHHLIGSGRSTADSKHSIALFQQPGCNGMKYFTESMVANLFGPGQ